MNRNRPISLALIGLFLWQTGCSSWQQIKIGELPDYDRVQVVSVSTGSTEIRDPVLEGDSIKGTVGGRDYAIPLAGVEQVEVEVVDAGKTVGLTLVVLGAVALAAAGTMVVLVAANPPKCNNFVFGC